MRKECSVENNPTANVPQTPQNPWTEIAPTGSSTLTLSSAKTPNTTRTPEIAPIMIALPGDTTFAPAVIPTSPAKIPFNAIGASNLCIKKFVAAIAARAPAAAAKAVFTNTNETAPGSALSTDPPLNPNQPNQSKKIPTVARGIL